MNSSFAFSESTYASLSQAIAKQVRQFRLSPEDFQDVQQEAFVRLIKHSQKGHILDNPAGWVSLVARNICLDLYRKKKVRKEDAFAEPEAIEQIPSQAQAPEATLTVCIEGEAVEIDATSLQNLIPAIIQADNNAKRKQVSEMWFLLEMNASQIAQATGLSQGTIRSHVSRFRQALRATAMDMVKARLSPCH